MENWEKNVRGTKIEKKQARMVYSSWSLFSRANYYGAWHRLND